MDTGSTSRNFISPQVADWLRLAGSTVVATSGRVCTAFGDCRDMLSSHESISLCFFDYVNNKPSTIIFTATVLDTSAMKNIDVVLGLNTIVEYQLASRMIEAKYRVGTNPSSSPAAIIITKKSPALNTGTSSNSYKAATLNQLLVTPRSSPQLTNVHVEASRLPVLSDIVATSGQSTIGKAEISSISTS